MRHILAYNENVIYKNQIDVSKWDKEKDIQLFNHYLKLSKFQALTGTDLPLIHSKFYDVKGPGYEQIEFTYNVKYEKSDNIYSRRKKVKSIDGFEMRFKIDLRFNSRYYSSKIASAASTFLK